MREMSSVKMPYRDDVTPLDVTSHVHAQKIRSVVRLAQGNSILDAGCGDGRASAALAGYGFSVIGCDLSSRQARLSKSRGRKASVDLEVCLASLTHLPFRTSSFDTVCCLDVLEHVPRLDKALEELHRVVGIGGIMIVAVPALAHDLIYDKMLMKSAISRFVLRRLGYLDHVEAGHFHVQVITPGMVRERLKGLGLQVDSFVNVSFLSTYLETMRNLLAILGRQSSRSLDRMIELDLRIAKHLPLVLGSSWLITLHNRAPPNQG